MSPPSLEFPKYKYIVLETEIFPVNRKLESNAQRGSKREREREREREKERER